MEIGRRGICVDLRGRPGKGPMKTAPKGFWAAARGARAASVGRWLHRPSVPAVHSPTDPWSSGRPLEPARCSSVGARVIPGASPALAALRGRAAHAATNGVQAMASR
eukprot:361653-Chlamydomonas_euryale.AAC.1